MVDELSVMSMLEPGSSRTSSGFRPWRRAENLELQLGFPTPAMLSNSRSRREAVTIVLEDDDDDSLLPIPTGQWSSRPEISYAHPWSHGPVHIPVLDDEDLELRLGPAGLLPPTGRSASPTRPETSLRLSIPSDRAIDLTHANDEVEVIARKRKRVNQPPAESLVELKLTCAICMDTMEEETSTVCGHIFCKKCITAAVKAQNKCPTCRRILTKSQIHRIYLSGSTK